jgi:hypothetical protein
VSLAVLAVLGGPWIDDREARPNKVSFVAHHKSQVILQGGHEVLRQLYRGSDQDRRLPWLRRGGIDEKSLTV